MCTIAAKDTDRERHSFVSSGPNVRQELGRQALCRGLLLPGSLSSELGYHPSTSPYGGMGPAVTASRATEGVRVPRTVCHATGVDGFAIDEVFGPTILGTSEKASLRPAEHPWSTGRRMVHVEGGIDTTNDQVPY